MHYRFYFSVLCHAIVIHAVCFRCNFFGRNQSPFQPFLVKNQVGKLRWLRIYSSLPINMTMILEKDDTCAEFCRNLYWFHSILMVVTYNQFSMST